jgi:hypothetical protein
VEQRSQTQFFGHEHESLVEEDHYLRLAVQKSTPRLSVRRSDYNFGKKANFNIIYQNFALLTAFIIKLDLNACDHLEGCYGA